MTGGRGIVVIGVGNEYRADDGAGLAVLTALGAEVPDSVALVRSDGDPASLLEAWTGVATAIVVDAVASGATAPGTLHRLDVTAAVAGTSDAGPSPGPGPGPGPAGGVLADRRASSHDLGVGSAVELAIALGRMPGTLIVHGIEGADFGHGVALSSPVAARIADLAAAVLADVRTASGARSP